MDEEPKQSTLKPARMRESVEFIRSPLAPSTSSNTASIEALAPADANDGDIPIDRRCPLPPATHTQRAAGHIPPARKNVIFHTFLYILRAAFNRGAHKLNSWHDFAFIQEFNTAIFPQEPLLDEIPKYLVFAGVPRGGDQLYDTAVLVSKRFNSAQLETEASCRCATFVTVSELGLLLVAIYGSFIDVQAFHQDIIPTVVLYQDADWTPIIAGDFNLAPMPADRRTDIAHAEDGLMSLYTESLNLCNVCEVLTRLNDPHSTVDRSTYFTLKMQSELGTPYVSRIDHILVPPHLLDVEHAKYGHMDVNDTFSDHKEISLYAPQTPPGKFFSRAAFRMPHNFPSDLVHNEKIEQILSEFNFTLTGRAAFEKYCKLIQDILQYARNQNRRHQNYLEHEILRLCKERMRLGNEQKGQGWLIHQDRIRVYKEQAVALAEIAGIDVQERVAQIWFKKGDRDPFWQSLITKQHMHPGIQ